MAPFSRGRAAVVVLGDIGRSPRMCSHAFALAQESLPFTNRLPRALYLLSLPFKLIIQVVSLFWVLCVSIPAPDFFILQWCLPCRYERRYGKNGAAHLCVTQAMQHELEHNWGIRATVLYDKPADHFRPILLEDKHKKISQLNAKVSQPLERDRLLLQLFVKLNEALTTPLGEWDCCSTALKVSSPVQGLEGRKEESTTGKDEAGKDLSTSNRGSENVDVTLVTCQKVNGSFQDREREGRGEEICLREDRPAIIISSTSWTADEDFGILLEAATLYDRRVAAAMGETEDTERVKGGVSSEGIQRNDWSKTLESMDCPYPRLLFIITGKGPQKAMYEEKIVKLRLKRVAFRTIWLEAEDYPLLLGSADLGVSLHLSSSGLDLPMKVVDMFGCGLPVAAMAYSCIGELVKEGENGVTFSNSFQLADLFLDFFKGFPSVGAVFLKLKEGSMVEANGSRWLDHWRDVVLPLLVQVCQESKKPEPEEKVMSGECSPVNEKLKSKGARKELRKKLS